jgi:hypothetical protein
MEKKDYHYILSLNVLCKGVNLILNFRETNFYSYENNFY